MRTSISRCHDGVDMRRRQNCQAQLAAFSTLSHASASERHLEHCPITTGWPGIHGATNSFLLKLEAERLHCITDSLSHASHQNCTGHLLLWDSAQAGNNLVQLGKSRLVGCTNLLAIPGAGQVVKLWQHTHRQACTAWERCLLFSDKLKNECQNAIPAQDEKSQDDHRKTDVIGQAATMNEALRTRQCAFCMGHWLHLQRHMGYVNADAVWPCF